MASRIGSVGGAPRVRRARPKRWGESAKAAAAAAAAEEAQAASGAAPIPPLDPAPTEAAPVISAQLMGQSGPAEEAPPAKSAARQARSAYLQVEYSGRYDRRTRRGRIAKTDV